MAKTNPSRKKQAEVKSDPTKKSAEPKDYPCPPYEGDYCAYYLSGGQWWPGPAQTSSGYYCPPTLSGIRPSDDGEYECIDPLPIGKRQEARPEQEAANANCEHCDYLYRNGKFYYTGGSCAAGDYCPGDLFEFARDHPEFKDLIYTLLSRPEIVSAEIRIAPRSIAACELEGHGPTHQCNES